MKRNLFTMTAILALVFAGRNDGGDPAKHLLGGVLGSGAKSFFADKKVASATSGRRGVVASRCCKEDCGGRGHRGSGDGRGGVRESLESDV